jgi:hypothetical protein
MLVTALWPMYSLADRVADECPHSRADSQPYDGDTNVSADDDAFASAYYSAAVECTEPNSNNTRTDICTNFFAVHCANGHSDASSDSTWRHLRPFCCTDVDTERDPDVQAIRSPERGA